MGLEHDKLRQSGDLVRIDYSEYIKALGIDLRSIYGFGSHEVKLNFEVDNIKHCQRTGGNLLETCPS